jgi:hypothetical protein
LRRVTTIMVISTPSLAAVTPHSRQVIYDVAGTHRASDRDQERNGIPVAVFSSSRIHGSRIETLEVLSVRSAVTDIREAEQQMARRVRM